MKRLLVAASLLSFAAAVPAVPPPSSVSPEHLVEQLGSDSYVEREAAMAALERVGAAAVPALEAATRNPNPEICKRAAEVLGTLRRSSDSKDRLATKPLRLSYRNIPLGTALNDLKSRTGINLALDPANIADPLRPVTCETGELPPWEAVAAFCKAAGLKEVFAAELEAPKPEKQRRGYYAPPPPPQGAEVVPVILADGKYVPLPGNRSTAVRVLALPAAFPGNRVYLGTGDVVLNFDIAPKPGLNWRDVTGIRITRVIDDAGRLGASSTIKDPGPASGGEEFFFGGGGGMVIMRGGGGMVMGWDGETPRYPTSYPNPRVVPVPIKVATPSARSLKLLEGAVVCEIAVPGQPLVTIENISRNPGIGIEGLTGAKVTVLDAKPGEKGGPAVLKVQIDTPNPMLANRRAVNFWNGGMLLESSGVPDVAGSLLKGFDAAGQPVRMMSITSSNTSNDEFAVSSIIQFKCPDGLPTRLVLLGSKPTMVEVPFKMENVPLP